MTKTALACLAAAFLAGTIHASAQTPIPASPVNPAQPVSPIAKTVPPEIRPATTTAANAASDATGPQLSIIADSSLRGVLQELAQSWSDSQAPSPQVPLTLTNSATIRTQVESHPTWDVIIDADSDDMKAMADKGLLAPGPQRSLARNIVVIYGKKALLKDDALDWFDLVGSEWKKIALGNPDMTTSGRVARRALKNHDLLNDDNKGLFTYAGTEALALQVAERDQADAVFLYRTDLATAAVPGFEVVPLSADDAPPVFYLAASGRLAKNPDAARSFIAYCDSDAARAIWTKYGFETD